MNVRDHFDPSNRTMVRVLESLMLQAVGLGAPAVYYSGVNHVLVVEHKGKTATVPMLAVSKLDGDALASYIMLVCP